MPNISTEQLYDLINNLMREFRDSDALKRLHFELITRLDIRRPAASRKQNEKKLHGFTEKVDHSPLWNLPVTVKT